ncbi:MAG: MFS transporter [Anaerolineales bacterium]|nr:MFS transporter [Anaerolineales bacterium]
MKLNTFRFWKVRNFLLLWSAQVISAMGDTFNFLALALKVDSLFPDPSDSARALSGVLIASVLPQLVFGLVAGTLVDRWDRKKVMIVSDLARFLLIPLYMLVQTPDDLPLAYVVAFLASMFSVMFYPARSALIPRVVSEGDLLSANGWMQIGQTMARLAGPALGGIVVGMWGSRVAFMVDSASFLISGLLILGIAGVATRATGEDETQNAWFEFKKGISFTIHSRFLQGITLGLGVVMLGVGGLDVLIVPFLRSSFQAGAEALGGLMTVQGIGMVIGGLAVSWLGSNYKPLRIVFVCMVILGVGVSLVGFMPVIALSVAMVLIIGLSLPPLNAGLQTMLQQGIPNEMLGRAGSVVDVGLSVASIVSMAAAGWVSGLIGIPWTYALCGGFILVGGVLMTSLLSGADELRPIQPEFEPAAMD